MYVFKQTFREKMKRIIILYGTLVFSTLEEIKLFRI